MFDENTPIVIYGPWTEGEYAMFERRCPNCGRLVKADETSGAQEAGGISIFRKSEEKGPPPNAICSRCGRVRMAFLGWTYDGEEDIQ